MRQMRRRVRVKLYNFSQDGRKMSKADWESDVEFTFEGKGPHFVFEKFAQF